MKIIEKRENGTTRVATLNEEPSKTQQQFKEDCDVNFIVKKFMRTGQLTHLAKQQGYYADMSEYPDLATAMQSLSEAQSAFDALPADLRRRFGNSPVEMVKFLQDPNNVEESIKLGLRNAPAKSQEKQKPGIDNVDPEPPVGEKTRSKKPTKETPKDE